MSDLPILVLLDEVQPSTGHAVITEFFRRCAQPAIPLQLLSLPCRNQPSHPLLQDTGPYNTWLYGGLPAHAGVIATSLSTAVLAAAFSPRQPCWLLEGDPFDTGRRPDWEETVTRDLLTSAAVQAVSTSSALARHLETVSGIASHTWQVLPSPGSRPHVDHNRTGPPVVVIDHTAQSSEGIVLAAEALGGPGRHAILLTDVRTPPYRTAFREIRINPANRAHHYARADLLVKVDSLRHSESALAALLGAAAPLAATEEAIGGLPARHGRHLWVYSAADAACIAHETELLLDSNETGARLQHGGHDLVQAWYRESTVFKPGHNWRPATGQSTAFDAVTRVLTYAHASTWNSTILRLLAEYYDSVTVQSPPAGIGDRLRRWAGKLNPVKASL